MTINHENAINAILLRATRARELAEKLERYAAQLVDDREVPLNERYTWAINEIENYIRNINFSKLARHTARINS